MMHSPPYFGHKAFGIMFNTGWTPLLKSAITRTQTYAHRSSWIQIIVYSFDVLAQHTRVKQTTVHAGKAYDTYLTESWKTTKKLQLNPAYF